MASDNLGDFKRGDGEGTGLPTSGGRENPPERRLAVEERGISSDGCRSFSPFAYTKLEAGDIFPGLGREGSTSEEAFDRASEAWKNLGEAETRSLNEFARVACGTSAVSVFALRLLGCSGLVPRAGLRSVRRPAWSPSPIVGCEYGFCGEGTGGVFVGEGKAASRRVLREPDRGVTLALRREEAAAGISSFWGVE